MEADPLTGKVIGCAIEVHRHLGPGLLESAYQTFLARELQISGVNSQHELYLPVFYKGIDIECGYRVDFLVEEKLIVELKAVERLLPIHEAQLLTYMKLMKKKQGLLLNFNVAILKDGIKRMVL